MSLAGLTESEVAARVARGQSNRVRRSGAAGYLTIAGRNVLTLFNALVLPAALALFWLDAYSDALAVSGMALTNTILGLAQEVRAKRHLDRLTLLTETRVRVCRDGRVREIPSGDVVLGDVLTLAAGDAVVADGTVLESRFLEVDEALLTGESDPVARGAGEALLSGSFCVAGEGSYRADRVGAASFAQRTAREARSYHRAASPIQISIDRLLIILTGTAIVLCLGYAVLYALDAVSPKELWQMIAATITSMVPQGLVLMATFAFVLGAVRMSQRGALVHRLNAVESMASIDTLCLDKTGTLTTNRLRLEKLCLLDETRSEEAIRQRLRLFASASLDRGNKSVAALRAALGETPTELLDQLPFKSQNRHSAVRVRALGAECVLVLGAAEALRPFLSAVRSWETIWKQMLDTGMRLLLFAEANNPLSRKFAGSLDGFTLRPLALVALSDELRPEARQVLEELAGQGIDFKILSGDNAATVRAAIAPLAADSQAAALQALAGSPVVSGAELEAEPDPVELIRTRRVFGRVSPSQKVQIVAALKKQGRHVAMIGDGVNDVLPIKTAHLGIAMGDGAAASKTVSGIVLETNDFALLPQTLDEGRTIVRNLRQAGKLFLVKNVFTLILIVGALGARDLPFPYRPSQVTLLNFLTIGVPAFLIMLNRERSSSLAPEKEGTRGQTRPGFLRDVGFFALRTGVVIGIAGLLLLGLSHRVWRDSETTQRTLLLSLLVILGLTTLLRALREQNQLGRLSFRVRDSALSLSPYWLAAAGLLGYLAVMYVAPTADFFKLTPLTLGQWGRILPIAAGAYAVLHWS